MFNPGKDLTLRHAITLQFIADEQAGLGLQAVQWPPEKSFGNLRISPWPLSSLDSKPNPASTSENLHPYTQVVELYKGLMTQ
jgi:hypothetical protein